MIVTEKEIDDRIVPIDRQDRIGAGTPRCHAGMEVAAMCLAPITLVQ